MKLSKTDVAQLRRLIVAAKKAYYNTGKNLRLHTDQLDPNVALVLTNASVVRGKVVWPAGTERVPSTRLEITDQVYDLAEAVLRAVSPDSPELKQTRAPAGTKQVEVELPYLMPSLDKKHYGEGTLQKWLAKYPGPYIIMDKLDGVSMELTWSDGQFDHIYKGGSSTHGMDWSNAIPSLRLPKKAPAGGGAIRCELIMSKAEFDAKWGAKYKNARNLTSGIVNKTRGMHEAVGSIEPVALEVMHKRLAPSKALEWAAAQGFKTVKYIKATSVTEEKLLRYLKTREKADHMIDGLVIAQDKPFPLGEGNPKTMVAFKAPSEGNQAETTITEIEWRPSRHGKLVPRITVKPVKLAGVTVTHATAHNAKYIADNRINVGSVVGLTRSGEVIPYITSVIKPSAAASKPDASAVGKYGWDANKTHYVLVDAKTNDTGKIKAIAHFFAKGLEVDGVGEGVVAQLYEAGYDTVRKILRMRLDDYMALDGWQERKSKNIYQAIKTKCQGADLIKAMAGSGILGPLLGERKLTSLFKQRPSLFDMSVEHTPEQITAQLRNVEGFKDKSAAPIIANMAKCFKFLQSLPITFKKAEAVKVVGKKMAGQQVVFTGVRSKEAELEIAKQGGTVASSVSAKTTLLVAKDPGESSSKLEKARSLGVKIVSLGQLNKLLGI